MINWHSLNPLSQSYFSSTSKFSRVPFLQVGILLNSRIKIQIQLTDLILWFTGGGMKEEEQNKTSTFWSEDPAGLCTPPPVTDYQELQCCCNGLHLEIFQCLWLVTPSPVHQRLIGWWQIWVMLGVWGVVLLIRSWNGMEWNGMEWILLGGFCEMLLLVLWDCAVCVLVVVCIPKFSSFIIFHWYQFSSAHLEILMIHI